jgi:hypothetical protein
MRRSLFNFYDSTETEVYTTLKSNTIKVDNYKRKIDAYVKILEVMNTGNDLIGVGNVRSVPRSF